jgi:chaperonin GroES
MKNLRPIGERIIILPLLEDRKTKGGIFIPDAYRKNLFEAEVIAVSNEVTNLEVGDRVIYENHSGRGLDDGMILIEMENVEAKIEGEDNVD